MKIEYYTAKFIIPAIVGMMFCMGCGKDNGGASMPQDATVQNLEGEYELRRVLWSGTLVDLDEDGTATNELLNEFQNIIGYWEPSNRSSITIREESAINVNARLPYPDYRSADGKYVVSRLNYLPVSILITDPEHPYYDTIDFNSDNPDLFLSSLEEACVSELGASSLTVRLSCSLFVDDAEENGYVYYFYDKL